MISKGSFSLGADSGTFRMATISRSSVHGFEFCAGTEGQRGYLIHARGLELRGSIHQSGEPLDVVTDYQAVAE